jgi:hypothetical protein
LRFWPASGAETAHALFGRRSTVVLGLALFVALALIRTVIVVGVGDRLAETRPQVSLKLGRDSSDVLASAALLAWQAKDGRHTSRYALAALDRSPLNVLALRTRSLGLDSLGKAAQAESLMQFAGTRGWRDDGVQAWLMRDDLAKHRFDQAFMHADALARRGTDLWPVLFLLFDVGAGDPNSSKSIAARLAGQPHWRSSFLDQLASSRQKDDAVERMFQLVDTGPAPLTDAELSDYPRRLARAGRYREALAALRSYRNGAAMIGSPFDGDFKDRPGVAPFAWERLGMPGASLDMGPAPDRAASNALRVEYDGSSATDLMRQALAPPPGNYLLTGDVRPEEGDPTLLAWKVRCADDGRLLATGSAAPGASLNAWARFAVGFTVPAQGCDGIWLLLTETPQELRSSNVTWYANLAIRPSSTPGATK